MKIEIERLCDGLFAVYQRDEGDTQCIVLSACNIAALVSEASKSANMLEKIAPQDALKAA